MSCMQDNGKMLGVSAFESTSQGTIVSIGLKKGTFCCSMGNGKREQIQNW